MKFVETSSSSSLQDLKSALSKMAGKTETKSILVFACDGNGYVASSLETFLQELSCPIFGGLFPQVISGRECLDTGFIVVGLDFHVHLEIIEGLSDASRDFESDLESFRFDLDETQTVFTFVDGLSARISCLIEGLFNVFGLEFNYLGGGAGSLTFEKKPCLFSNRGLLMDCAVLGFASEPCGVGVAHGWEPVAGPFRVTETRGNAILSLKWEPALQLYTKALRDQCGVELEAEDFFNVAKGFPFGIMKLGSECVVRDPIAIGPKGEIICVGEVPEESLVHVLKGDPASLVAAAAEAVKGSEATYPNAKDRELGVVIDCISRFLYLGNEFDAELNELSVGNEFPTVGALTLGEIANNRREYLEFYNKTAVFGLF